MRKDLTDITIVLDRSGSMESCRSDAEGGVNAFVKNQQEQPGDALLTLVQFDTDYEFVHRALPIRNVPLYSLRPRGATALLDAVGRAVTETGIRLGGMPENARPGLVIFVIVTDGHENSSREFSRDKVREMIKHQSEVYNWQFIFLGANQDAFDEAEQMAICRAGAATYSNHRSHEAYQATSASVVRMRKAAAQGEQILNAFSEEERQSMT